jgi:hypothetical protein
MVARSGGPNTLKAGQQGGHGLNTMIDDLDTVERLMERMHAALPMRAHVGRDVLEVLRRKAPEASLSHRCSVTEVRYAGDEGGILCTLDFDDQASKSAYIVSITHVGFDRRSPLWRDIEAYKKRRIKRLRRLQGGVA